MWTCASYRHLQGHQCIHTHTCTCIHTYIHTHQHMYAHIHTLIQTYTKSTMYDLGACICMHTHVRTHSHTHNFSISTINWSTNLSPVTVRPFTKHVGPTLLIPRSPLETFLLIFTTAILQWIVDQSNQYASQCMGDRFDTWQQITIEEMKAFMGFMILMGVVKLPSLADYWKRDEIFHYAPIASRITRDRFFDIQRYLHFADNSTLAALGADGYDRLGKIRPIIDMINERLLMLYHPHKEVSIDEAMIPFKGRSSMK